MNRTDRLLAIVLELQRRKWVQAEELADIFEVSKRTIYRDMQALSESGVPVWSMTGRGYALMEGYFLPPVNFSLDEALMLIMGADFMQQNFDAPFSASADAAARKIEAVLPATMQTQVDYLRQNITFFAVNELNPEKQAHLRKLRHALVNRQQVQLRYVRHDAARADIIATTRIVEPYSLGRPAQDWYLMAYCHLRDDLRFFRLSRMDDVKILDTVFERPLDFVPDWGFSVENRPLRVHVRFERQMTRYVREKLPMLVVNEYEHDDAYLLEIAVRNDHDILDWVLMWGSKITVLSPESLRSLVTTEATKMLKKHQ